MARMKFPVVITFITLSLLLPTSFTHSLQINNKTLSTKRVVNITGSIDFDAKNKLLSNDELPALASPDPSVSTLSINNQSNNTNATVAVPSTPSNEQSSFTQSQSVTSSSTTSQNFSSITDSLDHSNISTASEIWISLSTIVIAVGTISLMIFLYKKRYKSKSSPLSENGQGSPENETSVCNVTMDGNSYIDSNKPSARLLTLS